MLTFRFTREHADLLADHLLPPDGREAVAVGLAGVAASGAHRVFALRSVAAVPHAACVRTTGSVEWPTRVVYDRLAEAATDGLVIVKLHSHPAGADAFSAWDDASDRELLGACARRLGRPQLSIVLTRERRLFGRLVGADGTFTPLDRVMMVGDQIEIQDRKCASGARPFDQRHRQLFGDATTDLIGRLRVGVVGVSGTGSPLVEMLARLGVAGLVLVDDDVVEAKNLNRIYGATARDARARLPKVEVLARHVRRIGLGTRVTSHQTRLHDPGAEADLGVCDVLFGCLDSVEGRDGLNRLATRCVAPYFDLGVRLDADGLGGVSSVSSAIHYLRPGASSLKSRNVYSDQELYAEHLYRSDRPFYEDQVRRGYIHGVREDRPAVISINTATAALAVNELLARLHPFRSRDNAEFAVHRVLFSHGRLVQAAQGPADEALARELGLGLQAASERLRSCA